MSRPQFQPKHGFPAEVQLKHVQDWLQRYGHLDPAPADSTPDPVSAPVFTSDDLEGQIPEAAVVFDPTGGHAHTGTDSHTVDHANLANVTANQHHNENHRARHIVSGADAFLTTDLLDAIVKRLQESSGPTTLLMGAVSDGDFLKRNGTFISGATPPGATLAGDVTGAAGSNTVEKIRGHNVPAPGAPEDLKYLYYDHATTSWKYGVPAGSSSTNYGILGAWAKDDISTLGAGVAEIPFSWSKGANDLMSLVPFRPGAIVGVSIFLLADIGGVGTSVQAIVYHNGSPTSIACSVVGTAGTDQIAYLDAAGTSSEEAFGSGDQITVYCNKSGGVAATKMVVFVWGYIN